MNVLPLGSYIILLGVDWLYLHKTKVECYEKSIDYLNDSGEKRVLKGKKNSKSIRMVTIVKEKHNHMKWCV